MVDILNYESRFPLDTNNILRADRLEPPPRRKREMKWVDLRAGPSVDCLVDPSVDLLVDQWCAEVALSTLSDIESASVGLKTPK